MSTCRGCLDPRYVHHADCSRFPSQSVADLDLPDVAPPRIRTHYDGCWKAHHECAVGLAETLLAQRAAMATGMEAELTAIRHALGDPADVPGEIARLRQSSIHKAVERWVAPVRAALGIGEDGDVLAEIARLRARAALVPEVEREWRVCEYGVWREYVDGVTAIEANVDGWWMVYSPTGRVIAEGEAGTLDEVKAQAEEAAKGLGL